MSLSTKFASMLLIAFSLAAINQALADAPRQMELKAYALHGSLNSADISPDEELVVTESTRKTDTTNPSKKTFAQVIQIWRFKEDKLIAETTVQQADVEASSPGYFRSPIRGRQVVRFSPDGTVIVALIDQTIHVLSAADLAGLRTIPLLRPDSTTRMIQGRTKVDQPSLRAAELSPSGRSMAVLWVTDDLHGQVQIYDLSSGRNDVSWKTALGWVGFTKGPVWHPNGKLLLLAIPNATPCMSPERSPDVFAFDTQTGTIKYKLTTGLLTETIAVTADNRVLAVDSNCLGVFTNRDPKLKVFDLVTGKRLHEVSGRGTGVRYYVSTSADGSRFLAFTGIMKIKFDWGDFVPNDKVVDSTFSVWSLTNYKGIVTSHNLTELKMKGPEVQMTGAGLRLSSKGHYAVACGDASFIYELP